MQVFVVSVTGDPVGLVVTIVPDRRYAPRCGRCREPAAYRDTRPVRRFRHSTTVWETFPYPRPCIHLCEEPKSGRGRRGVEVVSRAQTETAAYGLAKYRIARKSTP